MAVKSISSVAIVMDYGDDIFLAGIPSYSDFYDVVCREVVCGLYCDYVPYLIFF